MRQLLCVAIVFVLAGCSSNSDVLKEMESQRAAVEKQQQTLDQMANSMRELEQKNATAQKELAAKEQDNSRIATELTTARQELEAATERVEREAQKPVVTVDRPEFKLEPKIVFPSAAPAPAAPPLVSADLIIHSVSVYSTMENGGVWDQGLRTEFPM